MKAPLAFALVAVLGCSSGSIPNGKKCGDKPPCPTGYTCGAEQRCWRDGTSGSGGLDGSADASVDAPAESPVEVGVDEPDEVTPPVKIVVTVMRSGNGSITGDGVVCTDTTCVVMVTAGSSLMLTAVPAGDSTLASWSGCTSTMGPTCTLTSITQPIQVAATFSLKNANLVVTKGGNGTGTVTATWAGGGALDCGAACSAVVPADTVVTLNAMPAMSSTFAWSAPCAGNGVCMVTIGAAATNVAATFTLSTLTLTVAHTGNGTIAGPSLSCTDPSCAVPLNYGDSITLTATPAGDSDFKSWSGCSTTNGTSCTVTSLIAPSTVTATFAVKAATFNVAKMGNGTGTVTATWAGGGSLDCGATCSASIPVGTLVTLAGTPAAGAALTWGAPCSGSGSCVVTVAQGGTTASATFALKKYLLSAASTGPGTITSSTTGVTISCGAACSASVDYGTSVTLVAAADTTGSFSAWTGCPGAVGATCTIVVTAATSVGATFKLKNGQDCGTDSDCTSTFCVGFKCCNRACNGACDLSCSTGTCALKQTHSYCKTVTGVGGPGSGSDILQFCNAAGSCVSPVITCPSNVGNVTCDLATSQCCNINDGSFQHKKACAPAASCWGPSDGDFYNGNSCNGAADCPTGNVCCYQHPASGFEGYWASCVQSCDPGTPFNGTIIP